MTAGRRTYHQHCGLARALDLVGERWTLLIVRELLLGPRRYGDLLESLDGITTNLLAKRLREMQAARIVQKREASVPAGSHLYELTSEGRALEPAVQELARWGGKLLDGKRRGDRFDIGWALLSMKRRYRGGSGYVAEVASGSRRFELVLGPERLEVQEKSSDRAELRVWAADQEVLFDVFFRGVAAEDREAEGTLRVDGKRAQFREMLRAFAPPPAPKG